MHVGGDNPALGFANYTYQVSRFVTHDLGGLYTSGKVTAQFDMRAQTRWSETGGCYFWLGSDRFHEGNMYGGSSNADYFHRYVSITEYKKSNNPKNQDIDRILKANLRNVRWSDRVAEPMARVSDRIRRKYYQDLVFTLDSTQFYETLIWPDIRNITRKAQQHNPPDSNRYNYSLNVSRKFDVNSYELRPHPEEQYRYDELRTMVRLCKERGVDIVFVVGPYNHVAFEKVHPEELAKMQQVPKNIISLLEEEHANYINCSDLSTVPGAFEDWQHPNSYGAYLIYQKIRDYVLEKENR